MYRRKRGDRWREYERIKAALQAQQLPPAVYEMRLRQAAKRLKV